MLRLKMMGLRAALVLLFLGLTTGLAPSSTHLCFTGGGGAVWGIGAPAGGSLCTGRRCGLPTGIKRCGAGAVAILPPAPGDSGREAGSMELGFGLRHGSRAGVAVQASATGVSGKEAGKVEFTLRRARPHELDLLAILSTEAFTPRGEWFDVVQRVKFLLVRWDLQAQFYQRFYHWADVVKEFKPPVTEARYALLAAAKFNGNAIGVTELCVAPNPASKQFSEEMSLRGSAPYLSNLAVDAKFRRNGIGQGLVKWCEELSGEWGHNALFLHVDVSNEAAIKFYRNMGFVEAPRDMSWYDRIGRQDLQVEQQLLLVKLLEQPSAPPTGAEEEEEDETQTAGEQEADVAGPL